MHYAHSTPDATQAKWQSLSEHLTSVAYAFAGHHAGLPVKAGGILHDTVTARASGALRRADTPAQTNSAKDFEFSDALVSQFQTY